MPNEPSNKLSVIEAPNCVTSTGPGVAEVPELEATSARAAFRRCSAAWQRAYKAFFDQGDFDPTDQTAIYLASKAAAPAFCSVMPMLAGADGIRDFVACTAQGIVIDAIPLDKGAHLLYAAQIAASLSNPSARTPRQPLTSKKSSR